MPQSICQLCCDKINDFYEYREMCAATNTQTRKLLGLPVVTAKQAKISKRQKVEKIEFVDNEESIFGVLGDEVKIEGTSTSFGDKNQKKSKKSAPKGRKTTVGEKNVTVKINGPLLTQKAPNKRELLREKASKQLNR